MNNLIQATKKRAINHPAGRLCMAAWFLFLGNLKHLLNGYFRASLRTAVWALFPFKTERARLSISGGATVYRNVCLVFLLFWPFNVVYSDDKTMQEINEPALLFLKAIGEGDYDKAWDFVGEHVIWGVDGGQGIARTKEEFLEIAPLVFDENYREAINSDNDITFGCCFRSRGYWETDNSGVSLYMQGPYFFVQNDHVKFIQPSFDCGKAEKNAENIICSNKELAEQDKKLAEWYEEANKFLSGKDAANLRSSQLAFLKERNECITATCIKREVNKRISWIMNKIDGELVKPPTMLYSEGFLEGTWVSDKHFSTYYCGGSASEATEDPPKKEYFTFKDGVVSYYHGEMGGEPSYRCLVSEITSLKYYRLYYRTAYRKSYWGSCGGSMDLAPFRGNYSVVHLKKVKERKMGEKPEDCGKIILTGPTMENITVVWSSLFPDDVLATAGETFKKINE